MPGYRMIVTGWLLLGLPCEVQATGHPIEVACESFQRVVAEGVPVGQRLEQAARDARPEVVGPEPRQPRDPRTPAGPRSPA